MQKRGAGNPGPARRRLFLQLDGLPPEAHNSDLIMMMPW